ncbi:putative rab [Schistosoma mansoni]|nr:putative rab [Schistosoma mansoni]|eukprot:XP_018654407.1 putative rab [Schistosoma mansoni]
MSEINANIQSNNNILIILVGNKLDEERNRMVSKKEGERLAKQTDALFWETSAKTGAHVDSMFHCIAE